MLRHTFTCIVLCVYPVLVGMRSSESTTYAVVSRFLVLIVNYQSCDFGVGSVGRLMSL